MSTTKQERNARILELLTEISVSSSEAVAKRVRDLLTERQHPREV